MSEKIGGKEMMHHDIIAIRTIDEKRTTINAKNVAHFDLDYSRDVARFDFINGDFIEFMKRNIISIEFVTLNAEEGGEDER